MDLLKSLASETSDDDLWDLLKQVCRRRGVNLKLLSSTLHDNKVEKIPRYYAQYDHRARLHDVCVWKYWLSRSVVYKILMSSDLKYISDETVDMAYGILKHILSVTFGRFSHDSYPSESLLFHAPLLNNDHDGDYEIMGEPGSTFHDDEEDVDEKTFFWILGNRTLRNIMVVMDYETDRFVDNPECAMLSLEKILFQKEHYESFCEKWNYNPKTEILTPEKILSLKEYYETLCKNANDREREYERERDKNNKK